MNTPHPDATTCCMDDYDPDSLTVEAALERIRATLVPITGVERVALRTALGRILAEDIRSRLDVPGHTNSAMDGYAIDASEIPADGARELEVIGTAWAGRPFQGQVGPGQCVRIMTGAAMPPGTDTVIMQEQVTGSAGRIRFDGRHRPGQNVRQAGEDIARGAVVLTSGRRLVPADLGLLASLGVGEVGVRRRLRVAFFSTGDELRGIGEPLGPGDIYDSNRYTLHGMLSRLGAEIIDMGVIRDVREDTRRAFSEAAQIADVVITSGGVSVGEADFVKETLDAIGQVDFWKVAMKPGRPLAFGRINDAYFFGLPGNPVSVMVTFYLFAQPALRSLMGEREAAVPRIRVPCASRLKKRAGRVEFQRGVLEPDESGCTRVRKTGPQGSGILTSMSEANCFIVLPLESEGVEPGTEVEVLPFSGMV